MKGLLAKYGLNRRMASLGANTAVPGTLLGTPVVPALAADSLIVSNRVASGDFVVVANRGGNSEAYIFVDSSAQTMDLMVSGVSQVQLGTVGLTWADDQLLRLGTTGDQVFVNRSTILAANTALTNVMIGTPVAQALAANSLIVSNVTASGDILIAANRGGNSEEYMHVDSSAGQLRLRAHSTGEFQVFSGTTERFSVTASADITLTPGTDVMVADATGLIVGHTAQVGIGGITPELQLLGIGNAADSRFFIGGWGAVANGAHIYFGKSRNAAIGSFTVVQSGDQLGGISFYGDNGTDLSSLGATMRAEVDGTPGTTDMPGRFVFLTSPDGSATPAERFRITAAASHIMTGTLTLASAAGAVEEVLDVVAHTLSYTGTTQVTSALNQVVIGTRTVAGDTATLTVDQANGIQVALATEGTNVTLTDSAGVRIKNGGGTPTNQYGIVVEALSGGSTLNDGIHIRGANTLRLGTAGTALGRMNIEGNTSGSVTVTVAAAAGTWTMTLPTGVAGTGGFQLTDANGDGICTWAAASLGEWKHLHGVLDPHEALKAVVSAPSYRFNYNPDVMPAGVWAPSDDMVGVIAEEAPWAMHGKRSDGNGIAFSYINAFGYARAAIQALHEDLTDARQEISDLKVKLAKKG